MTGNGQAYCQGERREIGGAASTSFKEIPPGAQLTPLLRICLHLFRHTSQISSAEESLLPPQFVLSDEKSGGATAQQSLCGIALRLLLRFYLYSPKIDLLGFVQCINFVIY